LHRTVDLAGPGLCWRLPIPFAGIGTFASAPLSIKARKSSFSNNTNASTLTL